LVLDDGDTEIVLVVALVLQLYVVAPPAVKVTALPEHAIALLAVTVGVAFTVTLTVLILLHPAVVPVTVYTVVAVGVTEIDAVVALVFQL
jgi:hypothetical protein